MTGDDILIKEQGGDGICAAYNRILTTARATPGCEGVVLLHDDTALGPGSRDQILDALGEPKVGLVGAVGGSGLHGPIWVDARRLAGVANDTYGRRSYGPAAADVDVVDGLLLALTPASFNHIRFDQLTFPAFHGYDTDYCLQVRARGLRVTVVPLEYTHVDKGDLGDRQAFDSGYAALLAKWPDHIRPLGRAGRASLRLRKGVGGRLGHARHTVMYKLKRPRRAARQASSPRQRNLPLDPAEQPHADGDVVRVAPVAGLVAVGQAPTQQGSP